MFFHNFNCNVFFIFLFRTRLNDPEKGYKGPKKEGLDFFVEHLVWKQSPKELFETFGGRDAAKVRRQEILVSQGKGKVQVPKDIPEAVVNVDGITPSKDVTVTADINEITQGNVVAENISTKVEDTKQENDIKTEDNTRSNRKRSLSMIEDDFKIDSKTDTKLNTKTESIIDSKILEYDSAAITKAQAELESALEEAEFQSLLLAQNENKIIEETESHVFVEEKLLELMPPIEPFWNQKNPKLLCRVPAVTWTMLDSK